MKRKTTFIYTYTLMDELMASTKQPLHQRLRTHQLTRMWQGLASIETAPEPTNDDWRVCSDAVNIMETLIVENAGWWIGLDGTPVQVVDSTGLLTDAVTALARAGIRKLSGGNIRLDAKGIHAVRSVLENYAYMLDNLPARAMVSAHRKTERRMHEILSGRRKPHDVEVVDL